MTSFCEMGNSLIGVLKEEKKEIVLILTIFYFLCNLIYLF